MRNGSSSPKPEAAPGSLRGPLCTPTVSLGLKPRVSASDQKESRLLDDLGHDAGADGAAAFTDGEAQALVPSRSA